MLIEDFLRFGHKVSDHISENVLIALDEPESRHEVLVSDLRDRSDAELGEMVRREIGVLREIECVDAVEYS